MNQHSTELLISSADFTVSRQNGRLITFAPVNSVQLLSHKDTVAITNPRLDQTVQVLTFVLRV